MNRAARRAAKHKARTPKPNRPARHPLLGLYILDNARPHEPGEKTTAHLRTLAMAERLIEGKADQADFDGLGLQINLGKIRALQIDLGLVTDIFDPASDAMIRAQERQARTGRLALDGPGIQAIRDVLQPLQAIIDASSPLQMRNARRVMIDAMTGRNGAWREYESKMRIES